MPLAFARTACGSADANRSAQQRAPTNVPPRPGQGTWAPILQPARRSQPGERGTKRAVVRRAGTHHIQTKYNVRHLPTPVPTLVVRLAEAQPWTGHGADRGQQPHSHGCELLWLVRFGQGPGTWVWPRFHWSFRSPSSEELLQAAPTDWRQPAARSSGSAFQTKCLVYKMSTMHMRWRLASSTMLHVNPKVRGQHPRRLERRAGSPPLSSRWSSTNVEITDCQLGQLITGQLGFGGGVCHHRMPPRSGRETSARIICAPKHPYPVFQPSTRTTARPRAKRGA